MQLWQFRQKVHASWIIATISGSVVAGAATVQYVQQQLFGSFVWLFVGLGLLGFVFWRRSRYLLPLAIVGGLVVGFWRGSLLESQLDVYKQLIGQKVQVEGKVSDDPDIGEHGELLVRLSDISIDRHDVAGKIWVGMSNAPDIKRSDVLILNGKMNEGFGNFSAVMYQPDLVNVFRPQPGDVALQVRDEFADKVRMGLNEPQASLGLGYLLGQRRALPDELTEALVITGLTHVVVASGYNLTILVRLARRLFVRVSKYLATASASTMIIAFMAITGASPSMSRAGLVAGLSLAAWYYGRRFHPLVLLPFAAAVTVLVDPSYAWNDLGWQLSFTAFAGVMILAPLLQRYFFGDKKPGIVRQILGETISASILTLPILIFAFGQFSNVAIITNLLILPFVPLAMLLTFITGISGVIFPSIAPVIGTPAQWLLTYMTEVVEYFAGLSWAQTSLEIQSWVLGLSYAAIVLVCIYLWRVTKYNLSDSNIVE